VNGITPSRLTNNRLEAVISRQGLKPLDLEKALMAEPIAFWIGEDIPYRFEHQRAPSAYNCSHCKNVVWREPPDPGGTFWLWCDCTTIAVPHRDQAPATREKWRRLVNSARSTAARLGSTRGVAFID
jgi:hypothetical protein